MTILNLFDRVVSHAPTGYTGRVLADRSAYNLYNAVEDTALMTIPRPWPAEVRNRCKFETTFELWLGKGVALATDGTGYMERQPYSRMEIVSGMYSDMQTWIQQINNDTGLLVINQPELNFLDEPTGQGSTNAQAWVTCSVQCRVWVDNTFDYDLDITLQ